MEDLEVNKLFNSVYSGRKVFITGHTGFKGSWLSFWLSAMGADVTGFSIDKTTPSHFDLLNIKDNKNFTGDVCKEKAITDAIKATNPDIIFHMAAQPLVGDSYRNPH